MSEGTSCCSWIMNYLCEMSELIGLMRGLFLDVIHSNNLSKILNIENTCNLIFDRCHLMELDWKKKYGHTWPSLSPHTSELLYSKTE